MLLLILYTVLPEQVLCVVLLVGYMLLLVVLPLARHVGMWYSYISLAMVQRVVTLHLCVYMQHG